MRSKTRYLFAGLFIAVMLLNIQTHGQFRQTMVIIRTEENNRLGNEWISAIASRVDSKKLDSLRQVKRSYNDEELDWLLLLKAKAQQWSNYPDSLAIPFGNIELMDTVFILVGHSGVDDGFTFGLNTVCFDLTALQVNYGKANDPVNAERINRLFAHEFTHLLSKKLLQQINYKPNSFRDSIIWECWYEGLGMYRSLSSKWLPKGDSLPAPTIEAMEKLVPQFKRNINQLSTALSVKEKEQIQKNLSRGNVSEKWGAFPVAIWLALEARTDERNLNQWVKRGPESVIFLAEKYLK